MKKIEVTKDEFNVLIGLRINKIIDSLTVKGKEYSRNNDPLHNFNKASLIENKSQLEVLDGYMLKHWVSYKDLLEDFRENKDVDSLIVSEKIGDIINYLIIQEIMMFKLIETKNKDNNDRME